MQLLLHLLMCNYMYGVPLAMVVLLLGQITNNYCFYFFYHAKINETLVPLRLS